MTPPTATDVPETLPAAFPAWIAPERSMPAHFTQADLHTLNSQKWEGESALMKVDYSSLNYKDALALEGRPGVIRTFPLVCGIDAVGRIAAGELAGEMVVVAGAGLGEEFHGGLARWCRVPTAACIRLPVHVSPVHAAAMGTAGMTAALSVRVLLERGLTPEAGAIAVTGASGGVGSIAITLLAAQGFEVHAVTGRAEEHEALLRALGAVQIVERAELDTLTRPLAKARFAGAIDAVGGATLAGILASLQHSAVATSCGLAGGAELPATVMPFILRGVSLVGIDSVRISRKARKDAWALLFETLPTAALERIITRVELSQVREVSARMLQGAGTGRVVVECA